MKETVGNFPTLTHCTHIRGSVFICTYMYLGDLVGLSTTNDLNWCSWGPCEVGVAGHLLLFLRANCLSGSVQRANSLAERLYSRLTRSDLSEPAVVWSPLEDGSARVFFTDRVH